MLSSDPDRSWIRIAKAPLISSTRPAMTSASAPFAMTRRFPLPARRSFASIDRVKGAISGLWLPPPASSAAAIFARFSQMSIRLTAMVTRSTMSRTRLFISTGGMASHRLESVQALRKATSKARASRSSGVSASPMSVLDEIHYEAGETGDITVLLIGSIPFENIDNFDWDGDEFYRYQHIYCFFSYRKEPYQHI